MVRAVLDSLNFLYPSIRVRRVPPVSLGSRLGFGPVLVLVVVL